MKHAASLVAVLCLTAGCDRLGDLFGGISGSGVIKTESRDPGPAASVDVSGAYTVDIVCQKEPNLVLEGDDNILPLIHTDVVDGKLIVSSEKRFSVKTPIKVHISTGTLRGVSASGASKISVQNVSVDQFGLELSGASEIVVAGQVKSFSIQSSGASTVKARDLHAARVSVNLSGAGHADVYATDEVNVEASGAASVTYFGDPKTVHKSASGAAAVNKGS